MNNYYNARQIVEKMTLDLNAVLTASNSKKAGSHLLAVVPDSSAWIELLDKLTRHSSVGAYVDPTTGRLRWQYDDVMVVVATRTGNDRRVNGPIRLQDVGSLLAGDGFIDDVRAASTEIPCLIAAGRLTVGGDHCILVVRDQRGVGAVAAVSNEIRDSLALSGVRVGGTDPLGAWQDPLGKAQKLTRRRGDSGDWQRLDDADWSAVTNSAIYEWFARRPRRIGYDFRFCGDAEAVTAFASAEEDAVAEAGKALPNRARHVLNELQREANGATDSVDSAATKQAHRQNELTDDVEPSATPRYVGAWLRDSHHSPEHMVMTLLEAPKGVRRDEWLRFLGWFEDAATGRHPFCTEACPEDHVPSPAKIGWRGAGQSTAEVVGYCDDPRTGLTLADIGLGRIALPKMDGKSWSLLVTKVLADLFNARVAKIQAAGVDLQRAHYQALAECGWTRKELGELSNQMARSNALCDEAAERLRTMLDARELPTEELIATFTDQGLTRHQAYISAMVINGWGDAEIAELLVKNISTVRYLRREASKKLARNSR